MGQAEVVSDATLVDGGERRGAVIVESGLAKLGSPEEQRERSERKDEEKVILGQRL